MTSDYRIYLFTIATTLAMSSQGAMIAYDDASDSAYHDGWSSGDNGGEGFGGWMFGDAAVGSASTASASSNGGSSYIDTGGRSFRLSDAHEAGAFIDVYRFLVDDLQPGDSFSIDMDINFRAGYKGLRIRGEDDDTVLFNFEAANDDYIIHGVSSGGGSAGRSYHADTIFRIVLEQTSYAGGTWTITRTGGISGTMNGTFAGRVSSMQLYTYQAGKAPEEAILFNNFRVVRPTPSPRAPSAGVGP